MSRNEPNEDQNTPMQFQHPMVTYGTMHLPLCRHHLVSLDWVHLEGGES
jgi:hypothetical protein